MDLLQLPRCLVGMHHRDRRRAWYDGPVLRSQCSGCGKPMLKNFDGWQVADADPAVTRAQNK